MKKRVLITGATGFVGYHLIVHALKEGLDVVAAVRPETPKDHLSEFNIRFTNLNYADIQSLKGHLETEQYSYIIHAAGITKARTKSQYNVVNAEFTRNLAMAAATADIPLEKFIFVSSLAAIGPLHDLSSTILDSSPGAPVTNYGASKLLAEQYLREIPKLPFNIIRPTAVYGPREKDIFILFKSINQGLEPYIGKFEQQLSFIYVTDLANVIMRALNAPLTRTAYNISDGSAYSRYTLGKLIKQSLGKRTIKFHLPIAAVGLLAAFMEFLYKKRKDTPALNKEKMAELTARNWRCDITLAKRDLGFNPEYNLERGIEETVRWYLQSRWL